MREIKAPEPYEPHLARRSLFLGGGVSNCPDWRKAVVDALSDYEVDLLNPRRDDFDVTDPMMEQEQIEWEHLNIIQADAYLFWFCEETVCPITLFELGKVAGLFPDKPLFVGTHVNYQRKRDIGFQMLLMRPDVEVVFHLDRVIDQLHAWAKEPFRRYLGKPVS